jgi:hypothetical protein
MPRISSLDRSGYVFFDFFAQTQRIIGYRPTFWASVEIAYAYPVSLATLRFAWALYSVGRRAALVFR